MTDHTDKVSALLERAENMEAEFRLRVSWPGAQRKFWQEAAQVISDLKTALEETRAENERLHGASAWLQRNMTEEWRKRAEAAEARVREYVEACRAVGLPDDTPISRVIDHHRGNAGTKVAADNAAELSSAQSTIAQQKEAAEWMKANVVAVLESKLTIADQTITLLREALTDAIDVFDSHAFGPNAQRRIEEARRILAEKEPNR